MCKKTNYKGTSNTSIDKCMRPLIKFLKKSGYRTLASCCGHGKYPMTVVIKYTEFRPILIEELFTETRIPRKRNFYKADKQGYYYIPEVVKK